MRDGTELSRFPKTRNRDLLPMETILTEIIRLVKHPEIPESGTMLTRRPGIAGIIMA